MTVPNLLTNNPSAGFIAWDSFHIQYLGAAYAIASGSTNKKYTWWPFNNGSGGPLQSSDTFPTTLTDDDLLLFLNKSGVPVNAQATSVLDGSLIVPETILAGSIGAGQIVTNHMTAGTIDGDRIKANTLTIGSLSPSVTSNFTASALNANPTFSTWSGTYPDNFGSWNGAPPTKETSIVRVSQSAVRYAVAAGVTNGMTISSSFTPMPYSQYVTVELDVYLVSGDFSGAGVLLDWTGRTPSRTPLQLTVEVPAPVTGKWYRVTKTFKDPGTSGTFTGYTGYLMAGYTGDGLGAITAKTIIFDRLALRPATASEVGSYETGKTVSAWTYPGTTSINGGNIQTDTVTATQIAANTITASEIAANTITANEMNIGVGTNVIANAGLENGSTSPHVLSSATSMSITTNPVHSGSYGLRVVCPTRTAGGFLVVFNGDPNSRARHLPIKTGDTVHAEFWARADTATGQNAILYASIRDASGTHLAYGPTPTNVLTTGYQKFTSDFTVTQPTAAYVMLAVGSSNCAAGDVIHVDDMVLSKKVEGSLIVDGAIDGKTITGATIQTTNAANSGIKIGSTGFSSYDSTGTPTFTITASSGAVAMKGDLTSGSSITGASIDSTSTITGATFQTAVSGDRIVLRPDSSGGVIEFYPSVAVDTPGKVNPSYSTALGWPSMQVRIGSGKAASTDIEGAITVKSTEVGTSDSQQIDFSATGYRFRNPTGFGSDGWVTIDSELWVSQAVDVNAGLTANQLYSRAPSTTAAASNVYMSSAGEIAKSTSSRRYKDTISTDLFGLTASNFLALVPKSFRHVNDISGRDMHIGFIAEEAADLGLDKFIAYNEEGLPDGFQYASWTAALQVIARYHDSRIADIDARLKTLGV